MRWFVEVSRVGDSTLAERYCVEAKAWQAALQETRKLRGDSGPLSKFSIELLDDGYRAVDPVQKIRYLVNQAPGDAPLVVPQAVNGSSYGTASTPPSAAAPSNPPAGSAGLPSAAPVASVSPGPLLSAVPVGTLPSVPAPAVPAPAVLAAGVSAAPAARVSPVTASAAPAQVAMATSVAGVAHSASSSKPGVAVGGAVQGVGASGPGATNSVAAPRPSPRRTSAQRTGNQGVAAATEPVALPGEPIDAAPLAAASQSLPTAPVALTAAIAPAPASIALTPAVAPAPVDLTPATPAPVAPAPAVAQAGAPAPALPGAAPQVQPGSPPLGVAVAVETDAQGGADHGLPPFEVFSSRIQEPTPDAPIAYREIACAVPPGTSRESVEALLRERLVAARVDFAARPSGQLVQIAIFDHVFEQRPTRAPLGTLAWKDWRGEPVLGYPAFGEAAPPSTSSLPPGPAGSEQDTGPAPVAAAQTPVNGALAAAAGAPPAGNAAPSESDEAEQPVLLKRPVSRSDSDRASRPRITIARRRAGEDLISELFESMHELHFARDLASGADFVLSVLEEVLPCEATLIQVFDINTRNFVVVRGRGGGIERAVLHRTPDNDALTSEIMRRDRARSYRAQGDARFGAGRWGFASIPLRDVLCGAVRQGGRYLGMIELANPMGDAPFHETEINALDYICEQFADFVASRPVVLDPDVILGR